MRLMKVLIKYSFLFVVLCQTLAYSQSLETKIDTTKNKIGAQFTLTLTVKGNPSTKIFFPQEKFYGGLEVIESYPIDTIKEDTKYQWIKKYGLTQFDTGKYTIPRIPVLINKKTVLSDSIKIQVFDVKVDTLKQKMYDIKPIMEAERPFGDWWKYLLGVLCVSVLGYLAYYFFKKHQNRTSEEEEIYNSPVEKASVLLELLEKKKLLEKGQVKEYYSEMTDIAREYIEKAIEIPAKESTTSELITSLRIAVSKKKMKLAKGSLEGLEKVLKQADLVKFAKSKPQQEEISEDTDKIKNSILSLHDAIPVVVDDTSLSWQKEQQEFLKKQKQKKTIIALSGITGLVLLLVLTFITITKGVDYVKNGFSGYSAEELWETDWIASEYGNPSIVIETPKVLKRLEPKTVIPKNALALVKEIQMFSFGAIRDHFYIMVSTTGFKPQKEAEAGGIYHSGMFKQDNEIDLNAALDATVKMIESQGVQNLMVKQEAFSTEKGVNGIKGYGTMTVDGEQLYYEVILFSQSGGLQQVMIVHKDGDAYGQKIADRMLNSVELKIVKQ